AHAIAPSDQQVISERAETYLAQGDLQTCWKIVEPLKFEPGERGFGAQVVLLLFQRRFDDVEKKVAPVVADAQQPPLFRAIARAMPLLEHALKVPAVEAITPAYLRVDPSWDPIRNDPRFQKLAGVK